MERGIVPLTLVAVLGGCVADSGDEGMLILKNVRADATCSLPAPSESEAGISEGRLDLSIGNQYLFIAQTKSRVTALTGQEDQRTIIITDAKVDLTFPGSTLFSDTELAALKADGTTHFKQLFSAPVAPNGGLVDVGFVLIPPAVINRIAEKLTGSGTLAVATTFTIEGDMSGATVVSQPFTFPVIMGRGVAVNIVGTCPLAKGTVVRPGYACNPAQDGIIDCCGSSSAPTCPATVSTM
jgi:hypothetical protein